MDQVTMTILMLVVCFGLMYFLTIRPQKKKEEEESRSHEEYLKRIEEDPLWELKQRSRKNTPVQREIPSVRKKLQNPYAAYDAGYDLSLIHI